MCSGSLPAPGARPDGLGPALIGALSSGAKPESCEVDVRVRIAIFDLDGTVSRRDTFLPFVLSCVRAQPKRLCGLLRVPPALLRYVWRRDRGELKCSVIRSVLGGLTRAEMAGLGERFVARLVPRGLFPAALDAIDGHRRAGDRLVLLSASPDLYVPLIARRLGFDEAICTGVLWQMERLHGSLTTPNRRGEEKARCLQMLRAAHPGCEIHAYGNSTGDLPHLLLADVATLVNPHGGLRKLGTRHGVRCVEWR